MASCRRVVWGNERWILSANREGRGGLPPAHEDVWQREVDEVAAAMAAGDGAAHHG